MSSDFSGRDGGFGVRTFTGAGATPRRQFGRKAPSPPPAAIHAASSFAGAGGNVDAILARFPGPVTLHRSRLKFVGVLVASLGLFVGLAYLLQHDDLVPIATFKLWLGLVVFAICALVAVVMLLPGAGSLTLDADGFERITLYMRLRAPWRRVGNFTAAEYSPSRGPTMRFVGYDDASLPADSVNRRRIGFSADLPDSYGLSHEELARLMNQWRALALAQAR